MVNFIDFSLLGQFVNMIRVHFAKELFWERVRHQTIWVPDLFMFGKRKMCSQN